MVGQSWRKTLSHPLLLCLIAQGFVPFREASETSPTPIMSSATSIQRTMLLSQLFAFVFNREKLALQIAHGESGAHESLWIASWVHCCQGLRPETKNQY